MNRIYTRTGDRGETGLFGGGRVPKSDARVAAYGEVDELNAVLGWVLATAPEADAQGTDPIRPSLSVVQRDLFVLGSHLATPAGARSQEHLPPMPSERTREMERWIDQAEDELEPLRSFILPGGTAAGAALHLARTVCRRAERAAVDLAAREDVHPDILAYLNRLSDLLFVFARLANHRADVAEEPWP